MGNHVEPWIQTTWLGHLPLFSGTPFGDDILTASLVLSLMVLPFITAVSRDVLKMVPTVAKEAGYGMGSTTWEVMRKISMRYALSGIAGAVFLGLGRALGETMAVALVIGGTHDRHPALVVLPGKHGVGHDRPATSPRPSEARDERSDRARAHPVRRSPWCSR